MSADLTPKALDALIEKAEDRAGFLVRRGDTLTTKLLDQLTSAVAALRAAPVAMRERIARAEDEAYARGEMGNPGHRIRALPLDAPAQIVAHNTADYDPSPVPDGLVSNITFRPVLAPVDPVAEAARVLRDALSDGVDALTHALYLLPDDCNQRLGMEGALRRMATLAQETRHD